MEQKIQHQLKLFGYKGSKLKNIFSNYSNVKERKDIEAVNIKSNLLVATIDYVVNELEIIEPPYNDIIDLVSFFPNKLKVCSSYLSDNKYKYHYGFIQEINEIRKNLNVNEFKKNVKERYPNISDKKLEEAVINIKSFKSYSPENRWILIEIDKELFIKNWLKSIGNRYELAVGCHIKKNNIVCPNCKKNSIKKAGGGKNPYIDLICKKCETIFEIKTKQNFQFRSEYFGGSYKGFKSLPKDYKLVILIVDSKEKKVYISKRVSILPRVDPRTFVKPKNPLYTYINLEDELEEWFTFDTILSKEEHDTIVDNIINNKSYLDLCKTYKSSINIF